MDDADEMRWLEPEEQRVWRSLMRMQMRLDGELARTLAAESGLSLSDYAVLVQLTDRPDGRMRIYELADELGWEKSRLSHHLSRMATRRMVCKEQCDSDRRGAFVVLTDHGRSEIEAAAPGHVATVRRLFVDRLSAAQLEAVGDAADTVLAALEDTAQANPQVEGG